MTHILSGIDSPSDLKALPENVLLQLANEIRQVLISTVAHTGGHIGPNLGVVELTIALHRVFNTPKDKLIFDVSHQAYVHKLLTGRRDRFHTIRQYGGLNGFMLRSESPHDSYGAGHAGTALSAALGMAAARDLSGSDEHVVVVAGDAAFTCGVSYEALNNVAQTTKRFIVILNDNEWSIAKNVGAIANYFSRIVTSDTYSQIRQRAAKFVEWAGGRSAVELAQRIEEGVKSMIFPSVIFEELGLRYFGPVDGHNIHLLIRSLEFLKQQETPVILHIITQKGRGFQPAIEKPDKFHGLGKFEPTTGETKPAALATYSEVFGKTLARLGGEDKKVVAITAAMPSGTGLSHVREAFPERYFDVGIAEEHAALFACGLATQGYKPFLAIYSTFMQRAYDMIIHDIALQNLNVRLCMDRAGLSGDDGGTHHGLFDIGYLRHIPNIVHMQPKDEDEFADMLYTMLHYESGPIAVRYPRGAGTGVRPKKTPKLLEIGRAEIIREGSDAAILGLGNMLSMAIEAADELAKEGVSVAVINPRWIKPLDAELILDTARRVRAFCTIEDHVLLNGFGASVIELLAEAKLHIPVARIGWPDKFIEHGSVEILREKHGITAMAAANALRNLLAD